MVVGEHLLRDLAVLHGHAVDVAREAQRQVGHVEQRVVQAAEALDGVAALLAEDGVHLVEAELVVAGGHRRVGGEDALVGDLGDILFGRLGERRAVEVLLQQADAEQRGVALVHVVDLGLDAERLQQRDAAEAEHGLLAEAVVGVAAVEVVGEAAVVGVVAFEVGVEQEDGDDVAGDAHDIEAPGADGDVAPLHGDRDDLLRAGQQGLRRPGHVGLGLLADGVEVLAEVSAAMHQGDGDHGRGGVRGGAQGVAGEHAQAAGVGGQRRGERDFHGEVGDPACWRGRGRVQRRMRGRGRWASSCGDTSFGNG